MLICTYACVPIVIYFFSFRCMLRVLDSFGTEPEFNHAHYAQSKGHKTPWGKWNLNPQQFYTMFRKYPCVFEEFGALKRNAVIDKNFCIIKDKFMV